ncbi:hypothetical protein OROHE_000703 [Orobanche hederae]
MFKSMDVDGSRTITFEELKAGQTGYKTFRIRSEAVNGTVTSPVSSRTCKYVLQVIH